MSGLDWTNVREAFGCSRVVMEKMPVARGKKMTKAWSPTIRGVYIYLINRKERDVNFRWKSTRSASLSNPFLLRHDRDDFNHDFASKQAL